MIFNLRETCFNLKEIQRVTLITSAEVTPSFERFIEVLLDKKVMLELWVKVKKNWTDDQEAMNTIGYDLG